MLSINIGKCLELCLQQDLRSNDFEILVVNDETLDNAVVIRKNKSAKLLLLGEN